LQPGASPPKHSLFGHHFGKAMPRRLCSCPCGTCAPAQALKRKLSLPDLHAEDLPDAAADAGPRDARAAPPVPPGPLLDTPDGDGGGGGGGGGGADEKPGGDGGAARAPPAAAPCCAEAETAERRVRLALGLKRYFHHKRIEGLLSNQALRVLDNIMDTIIDQPVKPQPAWQQLERCAPPPRAAPAAPHVRPAAHGRRWRGCRSQEQH